MRIRTAALVAACMAAALLAGCSAQPQRARAPKACVDVANSFVLVASERERGASSEDQTTLARERARSEAGLRHWLNVIDLVYRFDDASPREIGATVLDHCSIDEHGRAAVTTLWPGEAAPAVSAQ